MKEAIPLKKMICLLLALLFTLLFTLSAFAATEDISDPLLSTSGTVTDDQYGEREEEFEDEDTPEAPPVIEITDEALPQTGGIPAEAFYILGGLCIVSAILLLTRKEKPSTK